MRMSSPVAYIDSREQLEELIGKGPSATPLIDSILDVQERIASETRKDASRFLLAEWIQATSFLLLAYAIAHRAAAPDQPPPREGELHGPTDRPPA